MKLPGPDHPITIELNPNRVRVVFNGKTIADTTRALTMHEANHKPVFYIPREDAQMALTERTAHASHCPYKGDASYFSVNVDGKTSTNAIWSYETPFPAMAEIAGRIAFYASRVDEIVEERT